MPVTFRSGSVHRRFPVATAAVLASLLSTVLAPAASAADPPKIERLFPPGGQQGTTVEANVVGAAGDSPPAVWSARQQLTLQFNDKADAVTVTIPEDAAPGIHWLRFYNPQGTTPLRPFIVGRIPEASESEPNDEVENATAVEHSELTVNGVLEKSGDVDVFGVTCRAGTTLIAAMTANQSLGSPMDAVLEVLDPAGTVIAANDDDHGMDPLVVCSVPADGRYFVRTYAFPSQPNSTIRFAGGANYVYRLTVSTEAFVSHTIPAVLNADREHQVFVEGWNLGESPVSVVVPPFEGSHALLPLTTSLSSSVPAVTIPSLSEPDAAQQPLPFPSAVTGVISTPGERDAFSLQGEAGRQVSIRVAARSRDSLLDPVLTVTAADGRTLKDADDISRDNLDVDTSVKLPDDGVCTITVTDRYGHGGSRYFYVLTCEEPQPDFTATLKSDALVMPADKPLEIPVTINRANGFREAITVTVEQLPPGLQAEPVTSESEGDSAKAVTLKLAGGDDPAAAFQGVIRIGCTSADSGAVRYATFTLPDVSGTTSDLWLTVPPPPESE